MYNIPKIIGCRHKLFKEFSEPTNNEGKSAKCLTASSKSAMMLNFVEGLYKNNLLTPPLLSSLSPTKKRKFHPKQIYQNNFLPHSALSDISAKADGKTTSSSCQMGQEVALFSD